MYYLLDNYSTLFSRHILFSLLSRNDSSTCCAIKCFLFFFLHISYIILILIYIIFLKYYFYRFDILIHLHNLSLIRENILLKLFVTVKIVLLIFFGSIMSSMAQVNKEECDYYQNLNLGEAYYIYNPGYPFPYSGSKCTWTITSYHRINLKCSLIEFPNVRVSKVFFFFYYTIN